MASEFDICFISIGTSSNLLPYYEPIGLADNLQTVHLFLTSIEKEQFQNIAVVQQLNLSDFYAVKDFASSSLYEIKDLFVHTCSKPLQ